MAGIKVWTGKEYPLGASWLGSGTNFALFSEHATGVDLCLFDNADAQHESVRIRLTEKSGDIWHCFLPEIQPGQLYGYRVYGTYKPEEGQRFNASKLLIDPYAKAIAGDVVWGDEMFGYVVGGRRDDLERDYRDNAWGVPKAVVIDDSFDWEGDQRPQHPMAESVIYETHVKGFTRLYPNIPDELRGTYAGLASDEVIGYLQSLGVTAVELLPVHQFLNDRVLEDQGLRNFWGYNTLGFFAPHSGYAATGLLGQQVSEFKGMVKRLHAAGLEVILDVVYNHTCEGNHLGPTLSFRGIDNLSYYWTQPNKPRYYTDFTGCGNSFNVMHPRVLQLVMDSLRYWVEVMHVDGFRFDLASALGRETEEAVHQRGAFFKAVLQDPVLSTVKLIAEPWDLGNDGYQVGGFPLGWAEWNGKFRDCLRSYWKSDEGKLGEMAFRLTGSPDLYQGWGKSPQASVNFVVSHDGFTLRDLVSYNDKHNQANCEDNQDGDNHNLSWNCGEEGETKEAKILTLRRRQQRNLLATLLLSQGVPMLCAGDEAGRTQSGNNNAYCQDNEISWIHWERTADEKRLHEFVRRLIAFRKEHPVFRRTKFFQGRRIRGSEIKDIMWFTPDGREMDDDAWQLHYARCLTVLFSGTAMDVRDDHGEPVADQTYLALFNAHHEEMPFVLPGRQQVKWRVVLNTADEDGFVEKEVIVNSGDRVTLEAHCLRLLELAGGLEEHAAAETWNPLDQENDDQEITEEKDSPGS